jgi:hypothetical protein
LGRFENALPTVSHGKDFVSADRLHRLLLILLHAAGLGAVIWLLAAGATYYGTPLLERPRHGLHEAFKPSGRVGHGVGVVGGALLLLLFLYPARKRIRALRGLGSLRKWLDIHIWMGITGPLLIVVHSSFKVRGLVAISFWSMVAVALSGVLGRYLYLQIPRDTRGDELDDGAIAARESALQRELQAAGGGIDPATLERLAGTPDRDATGFAGWLRQDLSWLLRRWTLGRELRRAGAADPGALLRLLRRQQLACRRRLGLEPARRLLHHWHVIHRPFALLMVLFMLVHVAVALLFGFRWIF